MSLNFEHSDILLDTLLHSREQLKSERADPLPHSVSPRRRRTKSTAFEEPTVLKGFLGDWRSRSYGQDVAKLPETLIRKQETFTSIPEVEEEEEGRARWIQLEGWVNIIKRWSESRLSSDEAGAGREWKHFPGLASPSLSSPYLFTRFVVVVSGGQALTGSRESRDPGIFSWSKSRDF